jgi:hypothetical protein
VSAGLEITSNHCILQVKSPPLFIRSKWRCWTHSWLYCIKVYVLGFC